LLQGRAGFAGTGPALADARFQKFLRWLQKQQETAYFRSDRNRKRNPSRYR